MGTQTETPVTRFAAFKFKKGVSPERKGERTGAFLRLYAAHPTLLHTPPRGGRPLGGMSDLMGKSDAELAEEQGGGESGGEGLVKGGMGWDAGFVVVFKSDEARRQFDKEPGHARLKEETDPLLDKVFVYDFVEQGNLGW
ncbi:hypothetical protein K491DRAFT_601344 [Lophiostoma macrostomum CBS 122681]|uniref:Stress-response A/B barrel domain-containing protein n=1 Tax=Lophiostoma macrostomum CBS 122681 TaxID=1314788 RepID=A0A6A6T6J5_9PLEO|nr:hypothetical protein K491DRAFT_601344 [Lophiostoma macrostomum CBS 122681]